MDDADKAIALVREGLQTRARSGTRAAIPLFERATLLAPNSHLPWFMLGNASAEIGELDKAATYLERARDLHGNDHVIRYNLGLCQFWRGYIPKAIAELDAARKLNGDYLPAQNTYIMALHNHDAVTPEEISSTILEWGDAFSRHHPETKESSEAVRRAGNKLRIGFVSGDFRAHSVMHFFEPIASNWDRDRCSLYLYNNSNTQDSVTERMQRYADSWCDCVKLNDEELLGKVRGDRLDMLVDLSGHTDSNRLAIFARRAAPVQFTYLGFPNTTGLRPVDFRITDGFTDPYPQTDKWSSETLLRMAGSQWCFRPYGVADVDALPARAAGYVTFGSFNNLTKISETLLNCWVSLLTALPNSRLRLTRVRSPLRAQEICDGFARRGVDPRRIELVAYRAEPPYGAQFKGVDIALDHFPYNGVTTTCESLHMGVPVISMCGRHSVSRSGLSILTAIGLSELAVSTPEDYVRKAHELASDLERLETLRSSLRDRMEQSALRNERDFATRFQVMLADAWKRCAESRERRESATD